MSGSAFVEAKEVWFAYEANHPILRGLSLAIPRGDFVALLGQNGSGKTTFAKHLNGLLRPAQGRILLEGSDIRQRPLSELAQTVGYVFQNPDQQIFSATVFEEIAFGPRNLKWDAAEIEHLVQEALVFFGLAPFAHASPATLSYGLQRKVTLAAIYVMQTPLLILDEPTRGLDWQSTVTLMELLSQLHQRGRTILLITHDMRIVADYVPQTIVLDEGQVVLQDTTRSLFEQAQRLASVKLEPPQVTQLAQRLAPSGMPKNILTVNEFCDAFERLVMEYRMGLNHSLG